ncbi:TMEM175 family protein [Phenylobacterium sp.]|uniref:TMEM175 family protein n=1 Tax=Phenylobacterium sp. TaxID=1871053 RepID=UPI002B65DF3F|nr:TMEM175 family protein [Phenylobacterium sp.]HLZ76907.1 TMEM175 family protein [Phenylobacterium sp.]
MYPRHRLEALADGIFGVAMTLLVLEIRIPDGMDPKTDRELVALLINLWPKIWPYMLSFLVLGVRWRELVAERPSQHEVGKRYVNWSLANLLLVTFVPFSTLLIGRYASLAPAIWLYAANLGGMAFCAWMIGRAAPKGERSAAEETAGLIVFLFAAGATAVLGSFHTAWAPMGFMLNALAPPIERYVRARNGGPEIRDS